MTITTPFLEVKIKDGIGDSRRVINVRAIRRVIPGVSCGTIIVMTGGDELHVVEPYSKMLKLIGCEKRYEVSKS